MSSFNESVGLGYLKTNAIEFVKYPLGVEANTRRSKELQQMSVSTVTGHLIAPVWDEVDLWLFS